MHSSDHFRVACNEKIFFIIDEKRIIMFFCWNVYKLTNRSQIPEISFSPKVIFVCAYFKREHSFSNVKTLEVYTNYRLKLVESVKFLCSDEILVKSLLLSAINLWIDCIEQLLPTTTTKTSSKEKKNFNFNFYSNGCWSCFICLSSLVFTVHVNQVTPWDQRHISKNVIKTNPLLILTWHTHRHTRANQATERSEYNLHYKETTTSTSWLLFAHLHLICFNWIIHSFRPLGICVKE